MTPERLRRIEEIFHQARGLPDAERDAALAAACDGDSALERDVASLLAHAVAGPLDVPIVDVAAQLLSPAARLENGTHVGGYIVEAHIGSGGMGDVYRARDARLGRDVALKLLPASFTSDPDRVARFSREAQLLAALNHPHIAQIHGLERWGETQVLVLELVDGVTLDARIGGRPLPIDEALDIAAQIATALEAAHEKGIVHRDLKPANVALTRDHHVKILDFGLAKAIEADEPKSPALTGAGMVLGTTAYMAPEQAAGRRVDKRADVWAFGCVLYEMLTGARAFPGREVQETLASVMASAPAWEKLPTATPAAVRRLLRRCLEKDPSKRLRDIADAQLELADARAPSTDGIQVPRRVTPLGAAAAVVLVGGSVLATGFAARRLGAPPPLPVQRLALTFSAAAPLSPAMRQFALSSDGKRLAYIGANGRLWIRTIADAEATELPATDGAWFPFFSPDGEWVGYVDAGAWGGGAVARPGKLKKAAVHGSVPIELADAIALGGSWGRDGNIVFCGQVGDGLALLTIPASGGTPTPLTKPPQGDGSYRVGWPTRLPDDATVLFSETNDTTFESGRTIALSLRTGDRRVVMEQGYGARYVDSGHLVYALNGALMAVPFDVDRLRTTGPPVQILNSVSAWPQAGSVGISTANGLALYDLTGDRTEAKSLAWVARESDAVPIVADYAQFSFPRLSPNGRRLAVGAGSDVWILDLDRGTRTVIPAKQRGNYPAPTITAWTADGRRLVMNRRNTTDTSLVVVDPDDAEHGTVLLERQHFVQAGSWSRDGALAFFQIPGTSSRDVWVLDPGATEPRPFASTPFNERGAVFSPDGRWIAYASDATGRDEIYIRPYPGPAKPVPVSNRGGAEPVWSRTGREIFYRNGTRLMSVSFSAAPTLALGPPRLVFDRPFATSNLGVANYDVAPDGRFIMIAAADPKPRPVELGAIVNWTEELKARAPVRR